MVATPASGDAVGEKSDIGVAILSGGPVVRVEGPSTPYWQMPSYTPPNEGCTGKILPFQYNYFPGLKYEVLSAELVGADGRTVPVPIISRTSSSATIKLSQEVGDFGNQRPILRIYRRIKAPVSQESGYEDVLAVYSDERHSPCKYPADFQEYAFSTVSASGQHGPYYLLQAPVSGDVTVTGNKYGSKTEYRCVDGFLIQKSCEVKSIGATSVPNYSGFSGGFGSLWFLTSRNGPASVDYQFFDGQYDKDDIEIGSVQFLYGLWVQPSLRETSAVYFPQGATAGAEYGNFGYRHIASVTFGRPDGSTVARGTAETVSGGYQTVSLTSGGSGYVCEPPVKFVSTTRPYPERVGNLLWKCISYTFPTWIGVTKDGHAYRWYAGLGEAARTPTRVGQGARLKWDGSDYEGPLGGSWEYPSYYFGSALGGAPPTTEFYDKAFSTGRLPWNRIVIDRPSHGSDAARSLSNYDNYGYAISVLGPYSEVSVSMQGSSTGKTKVLGVIPHLVGSGYTSTPSLRFLEVSKNSPIASGLSVELVGPATFDRVEGRFFIDNDGNAWDSLSGNFTAPCNYVVEGTRTETTNTTSVLTRSWTGSTKISAVRSLHQTNIDLIESESLGSGSELSGVSLAYKTAEVSSKNLKTDTFYGCPDSKGVTPSQDIPVVVQKTITLAVSEQGVSGVVEGTGRVTFLTPTFLSTTLSESAISCSSGGIVTSLSTDTMLPMAKIPASVGIQAASGSCAAASGGKVGMYFYPNLFPDGYSQALLNTASRHNVGLVTSQSMSGITSFSEDMCRTEATKQLWSQPSWLSRKKNAGDLSVSLTSYGEGYTSPPRVTLSQKPHVAIAEAYIDGKVCGVAILEKGQGFLLSQPPTLTLVGGESSAAGVPPVSHATLTAVLEGPVYDTEVTSKGSGYKCPPEVRFSTNGIPAMATAVASGKIESITVVDGGYGHESPPSVEFSGEGSGAAATTTIRGFVDSISITDGGSGYTSSPTVTLSGGGGSGAKAIALLSLAVSGYRVGWVIVTDPGSGYTSPPTVVFSGGNASAVAKINGSVVSATVTAQGDGYTAATTASVLSGTATLRADVSLAVDSVDVYYDGEYRRQPTISLTPRGTIQSLSLTSGGSGYSSSPKIAILAACGSGATAACKISGTVKSIDVDAGGQGYTKPPIVELIGGYDPDSGTAAKAHAVCALGVVTSIVVDSPGSGYFQPPEVRLGRLIPAVLECNVVGGAILSVRVVSGGYGYSSSPTIVFAGGTGATANASVSNGTITSVSVINQGEGYSGSATATAVGGVGSGAKATAKISGQVSSVTMLTPGEGYEQDEPVTVLFSGGGGDGATATASIEFAGSGSQATARVNGSIVAVKVDSPGSYYQSSPRVQVQMTNNFLQDELGSEATRPIIQVRTKGKVAGVEVITGGSSYGAKTSFDSNTTGVPGGVSQEGGHVTSVDKNIFGQTEFYVPPSVSFSNNVLAGCRLSCLTGAKSVNANAKARQTTTNRIYMQAYYNLGYATTDRATLPLEATRASDHTSGLVVLGKIASTSSGTASYHYAPPICPMSSEPTVTVVDANGTGAAIEWESPQSHTEGPKVKLTQPGSGYTLGCTVQFRGGTPKSWTSPTTVKCDFDNSTGKITGITLDQQGEGYFWTEPRSPQRRGLVYVDGGGESEGSLKPIGQVGRSGGSLYVAVTDQSALGRAFKTKPRIVVVSCEVPAHRHLVEIQYGKGEYVPANEYAIRMTTLSVENLIPESAVASATQAVSLASWDFVPPAESEDAWDTYPHYWDGWVDHVHFWYDGEAAMMDLNSTYSHAAFFYGGNPSQPAAARVDRVLWSDVYANGLYKREPDE